MGGHGGKRDLAATFYKRRHGDVMGWQWCLLTSLECIDTGWKELKADAKAAAAAARSAYLRRVSVPLAGAGVLGGASGPQGPGRWVGQ